MGMPGSAQSWTREMVFALPDDGNRYELLDGELLVTPAPRPLHQLAVWALYNRIESFVGRHRLGVAGMSPADLDLKSGQLLQPDLFVVGPLPPGPEVAWSDFGVPLLVVEVLSPSTAFADRNRKRIRYQKSGIPEYWIIDTDARLIERWRPDDDRPEILTERIAWQPRQDVPALDLDLQEYFMEVWRESA